MPSPFGIRKTLRSKLKLDGSQQLDAVSPGPAQTSSSVLPRRAIRFDKTYVLSSLAHELTFPFGLVTLTMLPLTSPSSDTWRSLIKLKESLSKKLIRIFQLKTFSKKLATSITRTMGRQCVDVVRS